MSIAAIGGQEPKVALTNHSAIAGLAGSDDNSTCGRTAGADNIGDNPGALVVGYLSLGVYGLQGNIAQAR